MPPCAAQAPLSPCPAALPGRPGPPATAHRCSLGPCLPLHCRGAGAAAPWPITSGRGSSSLGCWCGAPTCGATPHWQRTRRQGATGGIRARASLEGAVREHCAERHQGLLPQLLQLPVLAVWCLQLCLRSMLQLLRKTLEPLVAATSTTAPESTSRMPAVSLCLLCRSWKRCAMTHTWMRSGGLKCSGNQHLAARRLLSQLAAG